MLIFMVLIELSLLVSDSPSCFGLGLLSHDYFLASNSFIRFFAGVLGEVSRTMGCCQRLEVDLSCIRSFIARRRQSHSG